MIIGIIMIVYGLLECSYVSSEFLASPNASWHLASKFTNENHLAYYPVEIRGSKYKVKVDVTFGGDYQSTYFNMTLQKGHLFDDLVTEKDHMYGYDAWPMEELYVTPSPNNISYSEEFIRNNFIIFGKDWYSFQVEENNVKSWSIEVYDYY